MEKLLICQQCSKEFIAKNYRKDRPRKYCSRKCTGQAKRRYESYEIVCQQCGNIFDNSHNPGRKAKFCSRKCWGNYQKENPNNHQGKRKIKATSKICKNCKEKFFGWNRKQMYCSKKCRGEYEKDPSKKSIFTCKRCNKEFETWTYRQPEFCSKQCMSEFAARQPKPNARRPENFLTIKCEMCGSKYKIHKGIIENSGRNSRFCSSDCMYTAMSKERIGKNNPNFVHGLTHLYPGRGQNWHSQRRKALKRDNHTCQVCHKQKKVMHVHHIVPYVSFDNNWKKANRLSNLVTLCQNCHPKVERGKVPCPLPNT